MFGAEALALSTLVVVPLQAYATFRCVQLHMNWSWSELAEVLGEECGCDRLQHAGPHRGAGHKRFSARCVDPNGDRGRIGISGGLASRAAAHPPRDPRRVSACRKRLARVGVEARPVIDSEQLVLEFSFDKTVLT